MTEQDRCEAEAMRNQLLAFARRYPTQSEAALALGRSQPELSRWLNRKRTMNAGTRALIREALANAREAPP